MNCHAGLPSVESSLSMVTSSKPRVSSLRWYACQCRARPMLSGEYILNKAHWRKSLCSPDRNVQGIQTTGGVLFSTIIYVT